MHEFRRMAYLEQLGIDAYVSRRQLPGAALTARLALVRSEVAATTSVVAPERVQSRVPQLGSAPSVKRGRSVAASPPAPATTTQRATASVLRFRLSAIVAGPYLWLESLGEMPLASEQVSLIRAMAHALRHSVAHSLDNDSGSNVAAIAPDIAQFDWPLHDNKQLDQGEEAARTSLLAFLQRRLEQTSCTAVVVLGDEAARWLAPDTLQLPVVQTEATTQMLSNPSSKAKVWADLAHLRALR